MNEDLFNELTLSIDQINQMTSQKLHPWELLPQVWPTEASYFTWVRGQLRRAWARHPIKLEFLKRNTFKAAVGKPYKEGGRRVVNACCCTQCKQIFPLAQIEVDHIERAGSFKGWSDLEAWSTKLLHISFDDLQIMCKTCHRIKSYAEAHNMTFEEAKLEKEVIAFCKLPYAQQVAKLQELCPSNTPTNAKQRRAAYREHLQKSGGNT